MKPLSPPHVQGEGSWGHEMKRAVGDRLRKAYDVALIRSSLDDQKITGEMMRVPGLAVVIVGTRKDSQSYVGMKRKACAQVGIRSFDIDLPEDISEAVVIAKVHELNADPDGCLELLSRSGISVKGKRAVVVGRSNIVGLPVSLLLLKADATVTIVHSHTPDSEKIIREADIIIAAAGQANMIKGEWIKPGAAVIDVGTNAVDDPSRKSGYRLVEVAGWLTPVPGGVGPMTVAMLLKNTLDGAKRKIVQ
ncbi:uncharacterized protein A4U43_C08F31530 [Asparagus officinalis]|nr:uncharacterized protein A4U43_C08F31530 [Asparagus officinalis]